MVTAQGWQTADKTLFPALRHALLISFLFRAFVYLSGYFTIHTILTFSSNCYIFSTIFETKPNKPAIPHYHCALMDSIILKYDSLFCCVLLMKWNDVWLIELLFFRQQRFLRRALTLVQKNQTLFSQSHHHTSVNVYSHLGHGKARLRIGTTSWLHQCWLFNSLHICMPTEA